MKRMIYLAVAAVGITLFSGVPVQAEKAFTYVVAPEYEFIGTIYTEDGLSAEVKENGKYYLKNFETGSRTALPDSGRFGHVSKPFKGTGWLELKRVVEKDGKKKSLYGLLDPATGKVLLEPVYSAIYKYMDGSFVVKEGKSHYIMDGTTFKKIAGPYNDSLSDAGVIPARILPTKDGKQQLADARGKVLTPEKFDRIFPTFDEASPLLIAYVSSGGKRMMGYLDAKGDWAVKPKYKGGGSFFQGRALVDTHDGRSLVIDARGSVITKLSDKYEKQLRSGYLMFSQDRKVTCKRGRNEYQSTETFKGLADRDGNVVLDARYTHISNGFGGKTPYLNLTAWTGKADKGGKGCKPITKSRYFLIKDQKIIDDKFAVDPPSIIAFKDKTSGLVGFRQGGNVIIAPTFEAANGEYLHRTMGVQVNGKWGIIEYQPQQ